MDPSIEVYIFYTCYYNYHENSTCKIALQEEYYFWKPSMGSTNYIKKKDNEKH